MILCSFLPFHYPSEQPSFAFCYSSVSLEEHALFREVPYIGKYSGKTEHSVKTRSFYQNNIKKPSQKGIEFSEFGTIDYSKGMIDIKYEKENVQICQNCGRSMEKPEDFGTNIDKSKNVYSKDGRTK